DTVEVLLALADELDAGDDAVEGLAQPVLDFDVQRVAGDEGLGGVAFAIEDAHAQDLRRRAGRVGFARDPRRGGRAAPRRLRDLLGRRAPAVGRGREIQVAVDVLADDIDRPTAGGRPPVRQEQRAVAEAADGADV